MANGKELEWNQNEETNKQKMLILNEVPIATSSFYFPPRSVNLI